MATSERKVPVHQSNQSYLDHELNSIRDRFETEMTKMEEEINKFKSQLSEAEKERQSIQQQQQSSSTTTTSNTSAHNTPGTATSTSTFIEQHPLGGGATKTSATTTERRTTTTTTRTVKSGETDLGSLQESQQSRSESRTGDTQLLSSSKSGNTTSSTTKSWLDGLQSPLIQDSEEGGKVLKLRFDVTQYEPDEIQVKTIDNRLQVHARHEEKSDNRSVYREYNREFHLPDGTDPDLIKSSLSRDGVLTVDCPLPTPQILAGSRRIPIDKI